MSREVLNEKQAALEIVQAQRVELEKSRADLAGEVQRAVGANRAAQVDAVITTTRETQARAEAAARALDAVVQRRDAADARADLLEVAEKKLMEEIQRLDAVVIPAQRAESKIALAKRLDQNRSAARRFITDAVADQMLAGVIVSDAGLAAIQALAPGQFTNGIAHSISVQAAAIRETIDRGEVLP